ncbi:ornithine cyclodeaminase/alanine dehydrogenase-like protein (mu-crystallin family) [Parabacteroides sp. PFB2-12]|uniref:ornithine cyclodeaminase n=1 Tax=unclassified Parabacteroides TaxID=2649774 RepID=UPI002474CFEB|nr:MULTISPECIES: ornithine cyclodeaminase [unclassified Parabacteroides]MDH6343469.1 ornithine cyclodeaminase/alanine dehydrogenase-like protein (mu-crystallin family) [Parabacteroides sp. PM6-13]MDH6390931.1 ornithine cyclodeaminase/alanine dehydrogenase-like protein (mu-crystallin family) [Parabacteroides sp. PFB2-12]
MKIISFNEIKALNISPEACIKWVYDAFCSKYTAKLPPKISMKIDEKIFFNTMPAYLPEEDRFGVKIVSRYPQREPALEADLMLFDTQTGDRLAFMDGSWITALRTGAVAALTIHTLQRNEAKEYAFIGLGNTARATLLCLLSIQKTPIHIRLLAYKGQEVLFMERFANYGNVSFSVYQSADELIDGADVVVSCVTVATELIASDEVFKKGVLLVPVHTRGFQNCDLFFDKVFADDTNHVKDFKYFSKFKQYDEFSKVLLKQSPGRESNEERILAYNIGIALHDIYFASKIYDLLACEDLPKINISSVTDKFWV